MTAAVPFPVRPAPTSHRPTPRVEFSRSPLLRGAERVIEGEFRGGSRAVKISLISPDRTIVTYIAATDRNALLRTIASARARGHFGTRPLEKLSPTRSGAALQLLSRCTPSEVAIGFQLVRANGERVAGTQWFAGDELAALERALTWLG